MFTPEKVIQIQLDLGVDILMPLDYCPSGKASQEEIKRSVNITINWAKRSKRYFDRKMQGTRNHSTTLGTGKLQTNSKLSNPKAKKLKSYNLTPEKRPALFGIVQGGLDPELRKYCAKELIKLNFDGYSVGGLAVDHETRDMWQTVKLMGEILPEDKPRYLMGVGTPDDIINATLLGMDMFDCVLPTRLARHGSVYTKLQNPKSPTSAQASAETGKYQINSKSQISNVQTSIGHPELPSGPRLGPAKTGVSGSQQYNNLTVQQFNNYKLINLLNSKFRTDGSAIDDNCQCPACAGGFSRAYISHLIRENEILGLRLATLHNLYQYFSLMESLKT